jgi:hypothetical protein
LAEWHRPCTDQPQHRRYDGPNYRILDHGVPLFFWLRSNIRTLPALVPIFCKCCLHRPPLAVIASSHEAAKALGWPVQTIKTGHDAVIITPGEVAAMLEQIG